MKQRIYIDTSVYGGNFDEEFAKHTIPLFERLRSEEFILLFSSISEDELINAPQNVRELVQSLKLNKTEFVETTDETVELATEYIYQKRLLGKQVLLIVCILRWQQLTGQTF